MNASNAIWNVIAPILSSIAQDSPPTGVATAWPPDAMNGIPIARRTYVKLRG